MATIESLEMELEQIGEESRTHQNQIVSTISTCGTVLGILNILANLVSRNNTAHYEIHLRDLLRNKQRLSDPWNMSYIIGALCLGTLICYQAKNIAIFWMSIIPMGLVFFSFFVHKGLKGIYTGSFLLNIILIVAGCIDLEIPYVALLSIQLLFILTYIFLRYQPEFRPIDIKMVLTSGLGKLLGTEVVDKVFGKE